MSQWPWTRLQAVRIIGGSALWSWESGSVRQTEEATQKEDEKNEKELYERVHAGVTKAPVKCSVRDRKSCSEDWS